MKELNNVGDYGERLKLALVPSQNPDHPQAQVIGAGPTFKRDGEYPTRTILVAYVVSFVVWEEVFKNDRSVFGQGDYFKADQLVEATTRFSQRVADDAKYRLPAVVYQAKNS